MNGSHSEVVGKPVMRFVVLGLLAWCAAFSFGQTAAAPPARPAQSALQAKLDQTEMRLQKVQRDHAKFMDRLSQIEANMDRLQKELEQFRARLKGRTRSK